MTANTPVGIHVAVRARPATKARTRRASSAPHESCTADSLQGMIRLRGKGVGGARETPRPTETRAATHVRMTRVQEETTSTPDRPHLHPRPRPASTPHRTQADRNTEPKSTPQIGPRPAPHRPLPDPRSTFDQPWVRVWRNLEARRRGRTRDEALNPIIAPACNAKFCPLSPARRQQTVWRHNSTTGWT